MSENGEVAAFDPTSRDLQVQILENEISKRLGSNKEKGVNDEC